MILRVYTIYDSLTKTYSNPFYSINDNVAKRSFCDLVQDVGSLVAKHPEDYRLCYLADYDDALGRFQPAEQPVPICDAMLFVTSQTRRSAGGREES